MSLHEHLTQLHIINEQVQALHSRIRTCADAFNGSQLEEASLTNSHASAQSLNNQFSEVISAIGAKLVELHCEAERLEAQILEQPTTTRSPAEYAR